MASSLAIDLGTTNTVIAVAEAGSVRVLALPELCRQLPVAQPPLIPSAVYLAGWTRRWPRFWRAVPDVRIGQRALDNNYDGRSPAFAQSFKPHLAAQPHRPALRRDETEVPVREAALWFLRALLQSVRPQTGGRVSDLTIPVPVGFYETYRAELQSLARRLGVRRFRTLDEPVAAALGYGVHIARDTTLLVVDFGGGTCNLAAVRLGPHTTGAGAAPILAKHMIAVGGDDVDFWLIEHLLMDLSDLPEWQHDAHWEAMRVKEAVSRDGAAEFRWGGLHKPVDAETLVRLLTEHGLYDALRAGLDEIRTQIAEATGDARVDEVLLVGGSTLLPGVAAVCDAAFPDAVVRHDPAFVFTAVASGAARFAGGVPVDDFVYHDYALAVQNEETHAVEYELLVARRTRYPTAPDFAVRYYADYDGMTEMRFHVCEVGRLGQAPVPWQARPNGGRYWMPETETERALVVGLNPADPPLPLRPVGAGTSPRLRVTYAVNADRWLCTTVEDLVRKQLLRIAEPVVRLR